MFSLLVVRVRGDFNLFYTTEGFPESLRYVVPREYVESVYQKVLLGDIIARKNVRNPQAMRALMKKVAETVHNEVSSTMLHGMLKGVGYKVCKDSVINYLAMAQEAYLIFSICNAVAKFVEHEGNPRYYFTDNGLLNLFLTKREPVLLENALAIALYDVYGDVLHYLKSSKKH